MPTFLILFLTLALKSVFSYDAPADIPKFFIPDENAKANQIIPPNREERFLTDSDTYLYVDLLFIQPRLVGLAFAVESVDPVYSLQQDNPDISSSIKKVYYPEFNHTLGYEVGLGVYLEPDGLEARINFMALKEHTHSNCIRDFFGYGFGTWDPIPLACSTSQFELHFYRANLDLVYSFFANQYVSIDTYFGVIASWQKQYYDIDYHYANEGWPITDNTGTSTGYPWVSSKIHNKCNYSGYGARSGITGQFYLTHQFSIRSDVALNLAWGSYGVDTRQIRYDDEDNATMRYNFNQCIACLSPVLDLSIAFCADRWFRQRSYNAALCIGYEEQIWFSQNRFQTPSNLFNGKGALFLEGAFIKFQITL